MFASRFIFLGEIVTEYEGTIQKVSRIRLNLIMAQHENDGNGIVEIEKGQAHRTHESWILNPYLLHGVPKRAAEVPGVWANHRCYGDIGCNLKLIHTQ
jgi:hypothetical protein